MTQFSRCKRKLLCRNRCCWNLFNVHPIYRRGSIIEKIHISCVKRSDSKTPFTRDRIHLISTFSSVTLRSHLLLPLFLWYVLIKFCNIITNLRVMLVLKLVKLYGDHTDPVPCERGLNEIYNHSKHDYINIAPPKKYVRHK